MNTIYYYNKIRNNNIMKIEKKSTKIRHRMLNNITEENNLYYFSEINEIWN